MSVPLVIAHRGDSEHAPQNTLRAFEQAIAKGADWIELDLQLTADDEIVVYHDAGLLDLTGRDGFVAASSVTDLVEIPVLPDRYDPGPDTRIPTLADVLEGPGRQLPLYLELKSEGGGRRVRRSAKLLERVLELVPADSPHALASFDADLVRGAIEAGRRAVHIAADPRRIDDLSVGEQRALYAFSALHHYVDQRLVDRLRDIDLPLWVWTVDRREDLARVRALGAQGICTNDVAATRDWLAAGTGA